MKIASVRPECALFGSRRRCLKAAVAFVGGCALPSWGSLVAAAADDGTVRRQLRFTLTLTNPGALELTDQHLWLYMPAAETATQRLDKLEISTAHRVTIDRLGQTVVELAFPRVAPFATMLVSMIADISLRSAPRPDSLRDPAYWLRSERFIEVEDPQVRALATELRRATPHHTAVAIFDWIGHNLTYAGFIADDLGALHALSRRTGDCTEYAYLAAALARANGIPARVLGGFAVDRNAAPRPEDYHNWTEVHIDGAWHLLDAQKGNWATRAEQYVMFHVYSDEVVNPIRQAHRFRVAGALQVRL